jgi:hypothetical protein
MKDWKQIASAYNLAIPESELGRVTGPLESLEKSFRPLVESMPRSLEPAVVFGIGEEETE